MKLEEMIDVNGLMKIVRGTHDILNGIEQEETLDEPEKQESSTALVEVFERIFKAALPNKAFVIDSDTINSVNVEVRILNSSEQCQEWAANTEKIYMDNPIPDTGDLKMDEFKRNNRYCHEISLKQFCELTDGDLYLPFLYTVDETGLNFHFDDPTPVIKARAEGKI